MGARRLTISSTLLAAILAAVSHESRAQEPSCAEAARSAEQRSSLPAGLLTAIGAVESGGWSWSVNGNDGQAGHRFETAAEAVRYTEGLLGAGLQTIDLGCFQVDLRYHPEAFPHWQDAFDDQANADAAAGILNHLHAQTGDWSRAVALYHSADPRRGQVYLHAVMSAWTGSSPASPEMKESQRYESGLQSLLVQVAVWGPTTLLSGPTRRHHDHALPTIITP